MNGEICLGSDLRHEAMTIKQNKLFNTAEAEAVVGISPSAPLFKGTIVRI